MKRYISLIIIGLFLFTLTSGCKELRGKIVKKNVIPQGVKSSRWSQRIEDITLAEAIMWPKPYMFKFTRDPFKPLVAESQYMREVNPETDLRLKGTGSTGNSFYAVIETPLKTKIYKIGDMVGDYKVTNIEPKKVILKKEDKDVILQIKGEK